MDFAVLVKVVPAVEQLQFDPTRHTLIRTGVESFLNPYDGRAVRVAVQLRRPGEHVTVLSMGPPEVADRVQETYAFGADRVVLVSDEALAGSDTLVTARVLERALRQVGHDLVLAGDRSVDSETGQVGPQLAGLLDVPVFTSARGLSRSEDGDQWEVQVETGEAWDRIRFAAPAVVTVNERILRKVPRPSAEEQSRARSMPLSRTRIAELGLSAREVGLDGSPTRVEGVERDEPHRHPRIFDKGTIEDRIDAAGAAVEELLGRRPPPLPELPPVPEVPDERREVLVLVSGPEGILEPASLGVVSEIRRRSPEIWPSALWVGRAPSGSERTAVGRAGAVRGYHLSNDTARIGSRTSAVALDQILRARPGLAGLAVLSTPFGREAAGRLSAARGLGLTGDAVGLSVRAGPTLVWRKPAFGGGFMASITSRTSPSLATVRPGSCAPGMDPDAARVPVQSMTVEAPPAEPVLVESLPEARSPRWGDLARARVVLIVGMGLGGPDQLAALEPSLERWGAALGGTRRVVDAGWLPGSCQVGLTGTSLSADLAVLLGVSGAANHLIGLRRTRVLLAVNPDRSAPVLSHVDVGIVGGWTEVLPRLTDRLAAVAHARTPTTS